MRNLARISNAANRIAAWEDWNKAVREAWPLGLKDTVLALKPPEDAGYRVIDKRTAQLKCAIAEKQGEEPDNG